MADRKAYTLLEVMLALALTTVTIALMGMAMHIHMAVAEKSHYQVEEANLARGLLQRIKDDLVNAVPYQPPPGLAAASGSASTSGGSAASAQSASSATVAGASSGTGATSSSGTAASSSSGTANTTVPVSGGIFGDIQGVQIETGARARLTKAMLAAAEDGSQPTVLSDVRIVSYSLGPPTGVGTTGPISDGGATGGLYRSEMDRLLYYTAQQQGQSSPADATKLGDPTAGEVVDLKFSYYDGSNWNDSWDSNQQGKLPTVVKVMLTIRAVKKTGGSNGTFRETVYDVLVDIPNSAVPASEFQTLAQVDPVKASGGGGGGMLSSASGGAQTPTGGGGQSAGGQ